MIRVCQFCHEVYGEKEPFEDKEETSGSCELCHWLWTIWYTLWREGMTQESASQFILNCRELFITTKHAMAGLGAAWLRQARQGAA